jgi:hypothetical protein
MILKEELCHRADIDYILFGDTRADSPQVARSWHRIARRTVEKRDAKFMAAVAWLDNGVCGPVSAKGDLED